jgi:hypothetical protein
MFFSERYRPSVVKIYSLMFSVLHCSKSFLAKFISLQTQRDEVAGGWRKLHNEELHNLYSSPSIIRIIKSRRMRWAGHVA